MSCLNTLTHLDGNDGNCGDLVDIGVLTVSDRASRGEYEDEGGPAILEYLKEAIASPVNVHYS